MTILLHESFIDNMWTIKILGMLVTPFNETKAYKLGIIDENGEPLKKSSELRTAEEKDSYDLLDRFVFNLKRMINKLPGGESKLKNITAAYFLVKEQNELSESELLDYIESINDNQMLYVSNMLIELLNEEGESSVDSSTIPSNRTGELSSTDIPVIKKKKQYKFLNRKNNIIK